MVEQSNGAINGIYGALASEGQPPHPTNPAGYAAFELARRPKPQAGDTAATSPAPPAQGA